MTLDLNADGAISDQDVSLASESLGLFWPPTLIEGQALHFYVTGTDPDGDRLTYTATNLPAGASFIEGECRWVPTMLQGGRVYTVTFTASDGQLSSDPVSLSIVVQDTL